VIRYDAVTVEGKLRWQDSVSSLNEAFYSACDGIFINYTWNEGKVAAAIEHLDRLCKDLTRSSDASAARHSVYFGVDVFGRGSFGGGQDRSSVAVDFLVVHDFSGMYSYSAAHQSMELTVYVYFL
jgi:mannosyl-glycoprotein endo-beta-N-acetylglucosaminidase